MAFVDIFIGVPQSKYAGLAILLSIVVVAIAILIGKEPIPMGQRLMFILIMFLISLPGLLLTLFQLTCLVSGAGMKNQRWWCSLYAWIGSGLIILYSVILVIAAMMSMLQGSSMIKDLAEMDQSQTMKNDADKMAKEMFENEEKPKPTQDEYQFPETFAGEMPNIPKMEGAPVLAPTNTVPAVTEKFADMNMDSNVDAMDPEMFSSCGAPVPQ